MKRWTQLGVETGKEHSGQTAHQAAIKQYAPSTLAADSSMLRICYNKVMNNGVQKKLTLKAFIYVVFFKIICTIYWSRILHIPYSFVSLLFCNLRWVHPLKEVKKTWHHTFPVLNKDRICINFFLFVDIDIYNLKNSYIMIEDLYLQSPI